MCCEAPLRLCVNIHAVAGILLKPQDFHFFVKYNSCRDTEKFRYFARQLV